MLNTRSIIGAVTFAALVAPGRPISACDHCNAVLVGGVFNEVRIKSNKEYRQSVIDFLLTSTYENVNKARSAGLNLGIPIEGLPVPATFGGNFSEQDLKTWQSQNQHLKSKNTFNKESLDIMFKWASKDILDAWSACVASCHLPRQGLSARASDPKGEMITVTLSWIPLADDKGRPKVVDYVLSGGTLANDKQLAEGMEVLPGIDTKAILIRRNGNSDFFLVINTTKGAVSVCSRAPAIQCTTCNGTGRQVCDVCKGRPPQEFTPGFLINKKFAWPDFIAVACKACKGSGAKVCSSCSGKGTR